MTSLVYVIGTYPRLTTTFIDREIAALRQLGVDLRVISLRRPDDDASVEGDTGDVEYVLPAAAQAVVRSHLSFLLRSPAAYVGTLWQLVRGHHRTFRARAKTVAHFGMAVHVARLAFRSGPVDHVHAHFVDRAAVVALVVGRLLGVPYSATAHANDIYVDPVLLDEKVSSAKFVATCTQANAEHLSSIVSRPDLIRRIYHGLDVDAYGDLGRTHTGETRLLAVGQLKEKKGFLDLVDACELLADSGRLFRCDIVGEGPQRDELERRIADKELGDRIVLHGAMSHDEVKAAYTTADVFVLPCIIGSDGDRDGIPNVILEAMASRLPVVSTDHSGIPEAVQHGSSGLLVPPGDATALASALGELIQDADLRTRFGEAGRVRVAELFDADSNVTWLLQEFLS